MKVWMVTGSAGNLKTSLEKDKWGVNRRLKNTWERVAKGDLLLFYVTSPVCGIVGVASVEGKSEENNILWHDEAVVGELYIRTGYSSNQFSWLTSAR
ncbi:MAG: EVE domain-containing protein [Candidatus Jordarchaeales archaeon]